MRFISSICRWGTRDSRDPEIVDITALYSVITRSSHRHIGVCRSGIRHRLSAIGGSLTREDRYVWFQTFAYIYSPTRNRQVDPLPYM